MSNEVKTKEKVNMDPKYIIKLTVTLLVTCVIVAGLLGYVNSITAGSDCGNQLAEYRKGYEGSCRPIPTTTEFGEAMSADDAAFIAASDAASAAGATLDSVYPVTVGGESAGYAIKVVASGSQGNIEMMVGVDSEGVVSGVSIVKNSETSGIGSKVMTNVNGVLDQFIGKSAADGTLAVGTNVDAISGATVSTKGVTTGVNAALAAAGAIG